jgi:hypothetical protein
MEGNHENKNKPLHLGSGLEKRKMSPFMESLERALFKMEDFVNRSSDILLMRHRNDKKYRETLSRIDFEYVTLLLKKLLRKISQVEANFKPEDFYLDRNSVSYNKDMDGLGRARIGRNTLEVNFNKMVEIGGKEFSSEERFIVVELVSNIIHEAIHLLAEKQESKKITTGFVVEKRQNESLNEGMTQLIAGAVVASYFDFKKGFKGDLMSVSTYKDERKRVFALMILIAKDTGVSLDAVIQSFATSYFHGDDVLNSLPELAEISKEAKALIEKLKKPVPKSEKDYDPFTEEELGSNQEVKEALSAIFDSSSARVVAQALKL